MSKEEITYKIPNNQIHISEILDEEEIGFNVIDAKEEHIQDLIKADLVVKVEK